MSIDVRRIYEIHTKQGDTVTRRLEASDDLRPASSVKVVIGAKEGTIRELPIDDIEGDDGKIAVVTFTPTETAEIGDWSLELKAEWPGDGGSTTYPQRGSLQFFVQAAGG